MTKDTYDNSKIIAKSFIQDKEDVVYINTHTHTHTHTHTQWNITQP